MSMDVIVTIPTRRDRCPIPVGCGTHQKTDGLTADDLRGRGVFIEGFRPSLKTYS